MPTRLASPGFTLVELLIVISIIGILAAFGYPAYTNYITESRRVEAHTLLTQIASRQERHYADNNRYAAELDDLGFDDEEVKSENGYWLAEMANVPGNGQTFEVHAAAAPTKRDEDCAVIAFDDRGRKGFRAKSASTLTWDGTSCW